MKKIIQFFSAFLLSSHLVLVTACDPISAAEYTIINASDSVVTIRMKSGLLYNYHKKDTTMNNLSSNEKSEITLQRTEAMVVSYTAMGAGAPDDWPLWEDLISIFIGSKELPQEVWNKEQFWDSNKSGGHLFDLSETHMYYYLITNETAKLCVSGTRE